MPTVIHTYIDKGLVLKVLEEVDIHTAFFLSFDTVKSDLDL